MVVSHTHCNLPHAATGDCPVVSTTDGGYEQDGVYRNPPPRDLCDLLSHSNRMYQALEKLPSLTRVAPRLLAALGAAFSKVMGRSGRRKRRGRQTPLCLVAIVVRWCDRAIVDGVACGCVVTDQGLACRMC